MYQRIGFQCLTETQFDDAGKHLFAGRLDPRVLISYYPELCGTLFGPEDAADVYAGVEAYMPPESSIDDISECCLLSPCLAPPCISLFRSPLSVRTLPHSSASSRIHPRTLFSRNAEY